MYLVHMYLVQLAEEGSIVEEFVRVTLSRVSTEI